LVRPFITKLYWAAMGSLMSFSARESCPRT
jgi:hypothetical protein